MACKDKCESYRANKPFGKGRYEDGQSRCSMCDIFMRYAGIWCPCCGTRLRKTPRSLKYKEQLKERRAKIEVQNN